MILVCGDVMLDRYWFGEVTRISPEAPVPVFSVKSKTERWGAAANVYENVKAMGVEPKYNYGPQDKTILKTRLIAKGQHTVRVDEDFQLNPIELLDLEDVSVVIFVDYGKGSLDHIAGLIRVCKKFGKTVLVDPKGYDYEKYRGADVVKPNLDEMRVMLGGWKNEHDLFEKAQKLRREANLGAILLTRASEGMTLYTEGKERHIPAVAEKIVDVTGAGETAIAALGVGLHRGLSLEESVVLANKAAGIAVGKFGPSIVTKEELEASSLPRHV